MSLKINCSLQTQKGTVVHLMSSFHALNGPFIIKGLAYQSETCYICSAVVPDMVVFAFKFDNEDSLLDQFIQIKAQYTNNYALRQLSFIIIG